MEIYTSRAVSSGIGPFLCNNSNGRHIWKAEIVLLTLICFSKNLCLSIVSVKSWILFFQADRVIRYQSNYADFDEKTKRVQLNVDNLFKESVSHSPLYFLLFINTILCSSIFCISLGYHLDECLVVLLIRGDPPESLSPSVSSDTLLSAWAKHSRSSK